MIEHGRSGIKEVIEAYSDVLFKSQSSLDTAENGRTLVLICFIFHYFKLNPPPASYSNLHVQMPLSSANFAHKISKMSTESLPAKRQAQACLFWLLKKYRSFIAISSKAIACDVERRKQRDEMSALPQIWPSAR
jgi:hypothetical protein